ncbi:hypothetical protein TPHV1_30140 [Treponema phagedenis]|uniref:Uncharacterized protein n=1 Tax=Treponema phagedenis TaxID=162 RepID=A0A0B7GZ51_TREPH|nr:hypothetical protein TPHV1_30140 [Treponema phagedenis]
MSNSFLIKFFIDLISDCNFTRGLAKFITRFGKKRVFLRVLGCFFVFFMTNFDGF